MTALQPITRTLSFIIFFYEKIDYCPSIIPMTKYQLKTFILVQLDDSLNSISMCTDARGIMYFFLVSGQGREKFEIITRILS